GKARTVPVSHDRLDWLDTAWYRDNLETIIGICRQHHIQPIFITQPDTWLTKDTLVLNYHWMFGRGGVAYEKPLLHQKLVELNEIMKEVALANNIPCFDAAAALPPDSSAFYDDCHLNPNGSKLMAKLLAKYILHNHLLDTPLSTPLNSINN
ncbi:MAG: hypothetical protein D6816_19540, partial [Bacteroidetes bacterium]